jgi:hypothetical protein
MGCLFCFEDMRVMGIEKEVNLRLQLFLKLGDLKAFYGRIANINKQNQAV